MTLRDERSEECAGTARDPDPVVPPTRSPIPPPKSSPRLLNRDLPPDARRAEGGMSSSDDLPLARTVAEDDEEEAVADCEVEVEVDDAEEATGAA